jgi:hypothetical protein
MSPSSEFASSSIEHIAQVPETDRFEMRTNKWKGIPVIHSQVNSIESFQEGLTNMTEQAIPYNAPHTNPKLNIPEEPGYIPSLGETRTKDIQSMIEREYLTFGLLSVAGISVVVLGTMVMSKS